MAEPAPLTVATDTVAAADGGGCALTRVRAEAAATRAPVVMLPGMFSGRRFWLSDGGVGLAAYLARCGHPVFIVQRRGLSDSPACAGRPGMNEHIAHDLPAVQAAVSAIAAPPAFWVGHSFGGVMAARPRPNISMPDASPAWCCSPASSRSASACSTGPAAC